MRIFVLIDDVNVVELDVQVLIYRMKCATDGQIVLQLYGDLHITLLALRMHQGHVDNCAVLTWCFAHESRFWLVLSIEVQTLAYAFAKPPYLLNVDNSCVDSKLNKLISALHFYNTTSLYPEHSSIKTHPDTSFALSKIRSNESTCLPTRVLKYE